MERGDQVGEVPQVVVDVGAVAHEGRQAALGRHAAHDHQMVANVTVGADHVGDPEVHVGGEAPVQLDLAGAHGGPHGPVAEVEEAEIDRLLQLVGTVTHEEDHRRVGLGHGRGGHGCGGRGRAHDEPLARIRRPVTRSGTRRIQCALSPPAHGSTTSRRTRSKAAS